VFNSPPPMEGLPWDDLRKILRGCQRMAKVPNGIKTLPKISTAWVRRPTQPVEISRSIKIIHGLYDTAMAPGLTMSQVSHTKSNMYTVIHKNVAVHLWS